MKTLLIGSSAIKEYYPEFKREPKDIDYACDERYVPRSGNTEYLYNPIIIQYSLGRDSITMNDLLTLKVSHLFWDINWEKHMFDVQFLLSKGHAYNLPLMEKLIEFWKKHLPSIRRSDLKMSKKDFFNNSVNNNTSQHDEFHYMLNPVPMFTLLLKEGSEVELEESKWYELSHTDKNKVVWEETAVMAFERYPNLNYRKSFTLQLKDNIIKHFPLYIALHAICNYPEIQNSKINFINTLNQKK